MPVRSPDMSWLGVLEHHARRTPSKPLAVFGDDVVTYQQMAEWAAALAGGLHARGVAAGDVVGLLSYNSIEFLATIFAANHVGAIAMPINWRLAAAGVAVHPRALRSARARVRRRALELANDATNEHDGRSRPRRASRPTRTRGGSGSPTSPRVGAAGACARRRATTSTG